MLPFVSYTAPKSSMQSDRTGGFLSPASADKHKNHVRLLEAWKLLHESGVCVQLHLTVNNNCGVLQKITQLQKAGVPIVNHGEITPSRLSTLYESCTALIYPSYLESFGLPLLEATAMGLPIIASEMDYVRDVVVPAETFDPHSAVSISRAVRRFLSLPEPQLKTISSADFLKKIFS